MQGQQDIFIAKYQNDGKIEWTKIIGKGGTDDIGIAIASDYQGNIYVTGVFQRTADFDGIILNSAYQNTRDIFLVKYHEDGSIEWAKRAGGTEGDISTGIFIDLFENIYITGQIYEGDLGMLQTGSGAFVAKYRPDGSVDWFRQSSSKSQQWRGWSISNAITGDLNNNIYLTGYLQDTVDFGGTTLLCGSNNQNIFVWKISDDELLSDVSDTLFSIVMPQALSEDVNMGSVLVSSAKDSVIKNFIRNGGSYPFRVDSITITGADASQFALVSGIPPFDIPSGGAHQVEFDFHPTSAGIKNAKINIYTQADTLIQNITGTGIAIDLYTSGSTIDFGRVEIGSYKDTTITAAIVNKGNTTITFSASSQLGPDMEQFTMQSADVPFALGPGASQAVTLRFAPKFIGRTSGRIAFAHNGANSPAILNVFGQAPWRTRHDPR